MGEKIKVNRFKAVPNGEEKCIWMEAGVIDYKLCNHYYNCHTCSFDRAMKETADKNALARLQGLPPSGKKASIVPWQEKMKKRQGVERKCRHTLTGRAPDRLCPYDFECHSCQFDQVLEDGMELQLPYHVSNIPQVDGYRLPESHFFHLGHSWARVEAGGRIRIGLDDFSMKLFGPADNLELPLTGEQIKFSEVGMAFKRGGKTASVLAPISGVVTAVNYETVKDPTIVKQEPYNDGWLMVLDPVDMKKNLQDLLYGKESTEWLHAEHQKLVEMVSEVGVTYADGGVIEDVVGSLPDLDWNRLTRSFLRT
ncbi:glycine cleavage system protein H [Desulfoferrobacter suflitae]|uniref:glycine cleavage system protein H n=1 Tax=Desulfoferrobacter suflitae TaxID=2865782 RepID=UPI002164A941|nr:glycine cleavage system protein H [Desulfoferrobacter suflitae]MCK8600912.1 glycine cleavage system protein H [Desulfoferrobacter suflitae]